MHLNRRQFLLTGAALSSAVALPDLAAAQFAPQAGHWRKFQVTTRLEITTAEENVQAWIPLPAVNEEAWFRSGENIWSTNGKATAKVDGHSGAKMLHVEWTHAGEPPSVEIVSTIQTRDRAMDLLKPGEHVQLSEAMRERYTSGTELIPVDGIVAETSNKIVGGAKSDLSKTRMIYDWMVENTTRDGKVRGCGIGDIASMLKSGNLTGKCADLNALFVGLVRAQGIPGRDIYGIRVAASKFGYKSLGTSTELITKAQHCRAEVFIAEYGWLACDPADVRKVMLEEPPTNLTLNEPKVVAVRAGLFGGWEGNWLAYNFANDVVLPESDGPRLGFLMYPQAECGPTRLDCLDPDNFKYTIKSEELTAT
jgi:transglutaminase-like putative cysteine protease